MGLSQIEVWIKAVEAIEKSLEGKKPDLDKARLIVADLKKHMSATYADLVEEAKPKTIENGLAWLGKRGEKAIGTWIALLGENNEFLKLVKVTNDLIKPSEIILKEEPISVQMKKRTLSIPALDFSRTVTGKITGYEWIQYDGTTTKVMQP